MNAQTVKRPVIPAEFYKPSILETIEFILYILSAEQFLKSTDTKLSSKL